MSDAPLCSRCFCDQGLRLLAEFNRESTGAKCPQCGSDEGHALDVSAIRHLAYSFFVQGSVVRTDFGGAPRLQINDQRGVEVSFGEPLASDMDLISKAAGIGVFHYGPRLWMIGEIEPLHALQREGNRDAIIQRILAEYPSIWLEPGEKVYRLRVNPHEPGSAKEYDAPPPALAGAARLNREGDPTFYASPDLQVCLHECRVSAEDDIYVGTLEPTRQLKLLDLTEVLPETCTEFESLDMAVHMLFLARPHAYSISQAIAAAARNAGFAGVRYPSYYSLMRTGGVPFETTFGLAHRSIPTLRDQERSKIVENVAIFGRPVDDGRLAVKNINRFVLNQVVYGGYFGPVKFD